MSSNPVLASALSSLDSDAVVITRQSPTADPTITTTSTIYSGVADVEYSKGSMVYDPSGAISSYDAIVAINPAANGTLPAVEPNDAVTINGDAVNVFTVLTVMKWTGPLPYLELALKRGPINEALPKR